jgi:hypothetical protein
VEDPFTKLASYDRLVKFIREIDEKTQTQERLDHPGTIRFSSGSRNALGTEQLEYDLSYSQNLDRVKAMNMVDAKGYLENFKRHPKTASLYPELEKKINVFKTDLKKYLESKRSLNPKEISKICDNLALKIVKSNSFYQINWATYTKAEIDDYPCDWPSDFFD